MGMEGLVACESFFSIFQTRPRYAKVHFVQPWSTKDGVAKAIGTLRSTYEVIDIERAMARHSAPCTGHHLGISYEIAGPFYVDIYIYRILYSVMSYHMCCKAQFQFHINFISLQSFNNAWRKPGGASRCWCTWILRQHIDKLCMVLPDGTYASAEMDGKTMTEVSGLQTVEWLEDHDWRPLYIIKWLHLIFTLTTIRHIICIDLRFGCRCSYSI